MATPVQRTFSAGEISPAFYSRADLDFYQRALRTMRNCFTARDGGAISRPGTQFVAEMGDGTRVGRLVPFNFDSTIDASFAIEMGHLYLRFHQQGTPIRETAQTITAITKADPAVVSIAAHGYSNGDEVYINGVSGMLEINNRQYLVANSTAGTFELTDLQGNDIDSTTFGAFISGGTAAKIFEVASVYRDIDMATVNFAQVNDTPTLNKPAMYFAERSFEPQELIFTNATSWTFAIIPSYDPSINPPSAITVSSPGVGSLFYDYQVTAVDLYTGEESAPEDGDFSAQVKSLADDTPLISWVAPTTGTPSHYRIYRKQVAPFLEGNFNFIGNAVNVLRFIDIGLTQDVGNTPQLFPNGDWIDGSPFSFPAEVFAIQQRLGYASERNFPGRIILSHIESPRNLQNHIPISLIETFTFTLLGRQSARIVHILELGRPVVFTRTGEWIAFGNDAGIITPTEINAREVFYNGSSNLRPLVVDNAALYMQAKSRIAREIRVEVDGGYASRDISTLSAHLLRTNTVVDWGFQKTPDPLIWAPNNDGDMLGLSYDPASELLAWHRHDTENGTIENAMGVPENTDDAMYFIVKRTINGVVKRYIERLDDREFIDVKDAKTVDCRQSFDGRNTDTTHTMTISSAGGWTDQDTLSVTSSTPFFTAQDVGKQVHITGADGTIIRIDVTTFSSTTVITGKPGKTVPVAMRNTALSTWGLAIDTIFGLWHLIGEDVSVFADGFVVASPNNASFDKITVDITTGKITLPAHFVVGHVGVPITHDIETLDLEVATAETLLDKKMQINEVFMQVDNTRGLFVGAAAPTNDAVDPLEGLTAIKLRRLEDADLPVDLKSEKVAVKIQPEWNSNGRVFVRQVDPLPFKILSIAPSGMIPLRS